MPPPRPFSPILLPHRLPTHLPPSTSPPSLRLRLRHHSQAVTAPQPKRSIPDEPAGAAIQAPRRHGKRFEGVFTPKPLPRPVGMPFPPVEGENSGLDARSLGQRRKDLFDVERHRERRRELTAQISRPYFRDWSNLQFHKGKSFLAPPRLFRADLSLYFPNLQGQTLSRHDSTPRDTTPLLTGRASVVAIFSSLWAERQVDSFVSADANPALHHVLSRCEGAQLVRVNYEDNAVKAWLVSLFRASLRARFAEGEWERYFLVRRGITEEMREAVGLLNAKVGLPDERESLVKGLGNLVNVVEKEKMAPGEKGERLKKRTGDGG
ncbi:hypothetical protein CDD80_1129 [Ophiocordyceps camponoti-rufipedis]|uniref:Uncharacterized protein n=1 Tax=Ophiocordyceps camponoti-rufipedis TaxID=2004952 RepID=A0A2C5YA55_9HYPO|nr:hypothetical protein CDD80_1129 [Ophiocordyceps camponoti-rufipedis]